MKSGGTGNLPVYRYRELKSLEVSLVYVQQPQIPCSGKKTSMLLIGSKKIQTRRPYSGIFLATIQRIKIPVAKTSGLTWQIHSNFSSRT